MKGKMPDVAKEMAKYMGSMHVDADNVKPGDKVRAVVHGEVSSIHQGKGDKKPSASVDIRKVEHNSPALKKEKPKGKGKSIAKAQRGYFGRKAK